MFPDSLNLKERAEGTWSTLDVNLREKEESKKFLLICLEEWKRIIWEGHSESSALQMLNLRFLLIHL